MFGRLLWQLLRGSRGRLAVALIAVVSGSAVISAMLNLNLDIGRKLTQEFRMLGANLVISSPSAGEGDAGSAQGGLAASGSASSPALMGEQPVLSDIERLRTKDVVAAAPYLYVVARNADRPVVVAGTWLDQIPQARPILEAQRCMDRQPRRRHPLPGRADCGPAIPVASRPASKAELPFAKRAANGLGHPRRGRHRRQSDLRQSAGSAKSGRDARKNRLGAAKRQRHVGQHRPVRGAPKPSLPGYAVRPIRQVTEAEGNLLDRTRLLVVSMVVLILLLTALCVLATMAALAWERREDVGLMKALGGSISRIVALFLSEVGVLGAVGGLIGCFAGIALSQWMGKKVFGASITPRWEIFPLTIALMVLVAMAGALPLRLLGKVKPATILRGGE